MPDCPGRGAQLQGWPDHRQRSRPAVPGQGTLFPSSTRAQALPDVLDSLRLERTPVWLGSRSRGSRDCRGRLVPEEDHRKQTAQTDPGRLGGMYPGDDSDRWMRLGGSFFCALVPSASRYCELLRFARRVCFCLGYFCPAVFGRLF